MNKLQLNKESIRNLNLNDAARVQGGYYNTLWTCTGKEHETKWYSCLGPETSHALIACNTETEFQD